MEKVRVETVVDVETLDKLKQMATLVGMDVERFFSEVVIPLEVLNTPLGLQLPQLILRM